MTWPAAWVDETGALDVDRFDADVTRQIEKILDRDRRLTGRPSRQERAQTMGVYVPLDTEHLTALRDQADIEGRSAASLAHELLTGAIDHLHDCAKEA